MSYGLIYGLGCLVAAFLSMNDRVPLERLALNVAGSWIYVIYHVLNMR